MRKWGSEEMSGAIMDPEHDEFYQEASESTTIFTTSEKTRSKQKRSHWGLISPFSISAFHHFIRPHRLAGLGHHSFKVKTRVRIPLGTQTIENCKNWWLICHHPARTRTESRVWL